MTYFHYDNPQLFWDQSGLFWDEGSPNAGNVQPYLDLITSEHNLRPKFMATIAFVLQPLANDIAVEKLFPEDYDVDTAVGEQLDVLGLWIGVGRTIRVPITGVFFSWNVPGLGWSQASWSADFSPTQLITLSDENYRILLRSRIAANYWDGTIPGAYAVWSITFAGTGYGILIQDGEDMHMTLALTGPVPDVITKALFKGGFLGLKPAGVRVDNYFTPTIANAPYFGWNVENPGISGWGVGAWGSGS